MWLQITSILFKEINASAEMLGFHAQVFATVTVNFATLIILQEKFLGRVDFSN